jgi:hypothetical protein
MSATGADDDLQLRLRCAERLLARWPLHVTENGNVLGAEERHQDT